MQPDLTAVEKEFRSWQLKAIDEGKGVPTLGGGPVEPRSVMARASELGLCAAPGPAAKSVDCLLAELNLAANELNGGTARMCLSGRARWQRATAYAKAWDRPNSQSVGFYASYRSSTK